jgi:hypothetical protein
MARDENERPKTRAERRAAARAASSAEASASSQNQDETPVSQTPEPTEQEGEQQAAASEPSAEAEPEPEPTPVPEPEPAPEPEPEEPVESAREAAEVFESEPIRATTAPAERPRGLVQLLILYGSLIVIGAVIALAVGFILSLFGGPPGPESHDERVPALLQRAEILERKTQSLETKQDAAEAAWKAAVGELEKNTETAIDNLQNALAARPVAVEPQGGDGEAGAAQPGLATLTARLDAIERELETQRAAVAAARRAGSGVKDDEATTTTIHSEAIAILATRLRQELEIGHPFASEIAALERLGFPEAELVPLHPYAETGVASVRQLTAQFTELAPALLKTEPGKPQGSLIDRVTNYASGLVKVEAVDESSRTDLRGFVARIKTALAQNNVAEAYSVWTEMPQAARDGSSSFGEAAKARLDAVAAARSIETAATAALGKPKS